MKKKTSALITSCAAIAVCSSLIVGSTYALFTGESKVDITVSSGKVNLMSTISNIRTGYDEEHLSSANENLNAEYDGETKLLKLENLVPGDYVTFDLDITNDSSVNILYRFGYECLGGYLLMNGLNVSINKKDETSLPLNNYKSYKTAWEMIEYSSNANNIQYNVKVELPYEASNVYGGLSTDLTFNVEAVQGNANVSGGAETEMLPDYSEAIEAYDNGTLTIVSAPKDLKSACEKGGYILFNSDIETPRQGFKENGETVYYTHSRYNITTDAVIDLNGYEFVGGFKTYKKDSNPASVVIKNGDINAAENSLYRGFQGAGYNFTTTFENLNIYGGLYCAYVGWGDNLIIKSGTYEALGGGAPYFNNFLLNIEDKSTTSHITVEGGTFKNYNPAQSNSERPEASFVAEGYTVETKTVGEDVWYTVVPQS